MADLGSVGKKLPAGLYSKVGPEAILGKGGQFAGYPVDGAISGNVKISGANASGVVVRLYYRNNGAFIEQTISDSSGNYSFVGLNKADPKAFYVVFVDPNKDAPYNYTVARDHISAG